MERFESEVTSLPDSEDGLPRPEFISPNAEAIAFERRQLTDEGKDPDRVDQLFDRYLDLDDEPTVEALQNVLDEAQELPTRKGFEYHEPETLIEIRRARPDGPRMIECNLSEADRFDAIYGGWLGACAGCLLGKPVQGWPHEKIIAFLEATDSYPLQKYLSSDIPEDVKSKFDMYTTVEISSEEDSFYINDVQHMPRDDDIDYIGIGLGVLKEHGLSFEMGDVANYWLQNLPAFNTYTAERVAYRNFMNLISPPESGRFRNPYREMVGALIRADFWGYTSIGNPEQAAELAWRDASISHVKNGVYGEMWAAAMIAVAPMHTDPRRIIELGLSEIPEQCRLAESIKNVLEWHADGIKYEEAASRVHDRWNDRSKYHWLHTISNAEIVAIGLLWGDGDLGKSICRAVQTGFDTDSHGATVGSIVGMMRGADALPTEWIDPLNDTVDMSLTSYQQCQIMDLARESALVIRRATD